MKHSFYPRDTAIARQRSHNLLKQATSIMLKQKPTQESPSRGTPLSSKPRSPSTDVAKGTGSAKRIRNNSVSGGGDPVLYAPEVWATLHRKLMVENLNGADPPRPYTGPAPAKFDPPKDLRKLMDRQCAKRGQEKWTRCTHLLGGADKIT